MGKGRKPIPKKIKLLRGNPGKRKLAEQPEPAPGLPPCPESLSDAAKRAWARLAAEINGMGVGTRADGFILEQLAEVYARLLLARADIEENGLTVEGAQGIKKNPTVTVAVECERLIQSLASEFGLTPASRNRLGSTKEPQDALEQFIGPQISKRTG